MSYKKMDYKKTFATRTFEKLAMKSGKQWGKSLGNAKVLTKMKK